MDEFGVPVVKCSVAGCHCDSEQRLDKYGALLEHVTTKELLCVSHAVDAVRSGRITGWDFNDYVWERLSEEKKTILEADYGSTCIYPQCACGFRLVADDIDVWLEDVARDPKCENCDSEAEEEDEAPCDRCGSIKDDPALGKHCLWESNTEPGVSICRECVGKEGEMEKAK